MEFTIASTKDIPVGEMIGAATSGKEILIANVGGKYYAIQNICTHAGCTLSDGVLKGEKVQCPCHGSTFDVRTGLVVKGPTLDNEPTFKLRVNGDQILVDI